MAQGQPGNGTAGPGNGNGGHAGSFTPANHAEPHADHDDGPGDDAEDDGSDQ
jgi:hypothetical protein